MVVQRSPSPPSVKNGARQTTVVAPEMVAARHAHNRNAHFGQCRANRVSLILAIKTLYLDRGLDSDICVVARYKMQGGRAD